MTKLEKAAIEWYEARREWKASLTGAGLDKKYQALEKLYALCEEAVNSQPDPIDEANEILEGWDLDIRHKPDGTPVLHQWNEPGYLIPLEDLLLAISRLNNGT